MSHKDLKYFFFLILFHNYQRSNEELEEKQGPILLFSAVLGGTFPPLRLGLYIR